MLELKTEAFGTINLLVTKGSVAEFEYFFKKPILNCIAEEWNSKHWFVMGYEAYKMACLKNREPHKYSLQDFQLDLTDSDFTAMVQVLDKALDELLGLTKLREAVEEQAKKKSKR